MHKRRFGAQHLAGPNVSCREWIHSIGALPFPGAVHEQIDSPCVMRYNFCVPSPAVQRSASAAGASSSTCTASTGSALRCGPAALLRSDRLPVCSDGLCAQLCRRCDRHSDDFYPDWQSPASNAATPAGCHTPATARWRRWSDRTQANGDRRAIPEAESALNINNY